jgi:hypothetical protein
MDATVPRGALAQAIGTGMLSRDDQAARNPLNRRILPLLAAELPRRSSLDSLTSRTNANRRVEVMMATTGVQTRFQLALQAVRRGWIKS